MHLARIIVWPLAMSYGGLILTGQGLGTFNHLSVTEGSLGALMGFLLALMFNLREKRHRRPTLVAHSIAHFFPECNIPSPKRKDG
jgi:hypothetical protein